ncbi:MAG: GNAT family N-acetyltransferase [Actinomycetota bacterium]
MAQSMAAIETGRLLLRPFEPGDAEQLLGILGDSDTMVYYEAAFTPEQVEAWVVRNIERYEEDGTGLWAIEERATGEFVGDCGLVHQLVDGTDELEVGWHVKRSRWGQGIAPEAGTAFRDRALGDLGYERLISLIRPENVQSRRVAEKLGMSVEKETLFGSMGWRHFVYALTRRHPDESEH